jgi:FkbM family methyltransferase
MCDYFILTKPTNVETNNNTQNQIVCLNGKAYILPKNNLNYYINHGLFENGLIEWCKQFCRKDQNILDIGAHSGTYTISLADYSKHVYAFEPQKMTFYSLCGSVALSNIKNVTCINYGLGSTEQVGKQKLNIVSLDGGGSSLHNNNNNNSLQTEEIEVITLDSLNLDNIGFIKIDVEENELQTLMGSQNTLIKSNYPKILFEMNKECPQLLGFLQSLNYNIVSVGGCNNMFLAVNTLKTQN